MPYANDYNRSVSQQLRTIDQNHINRIQSISETNPFDVMSRLEATALVNQNIHGGSGYSAATVQDLGFEPTMGATPAATGGRMRRTRAQRDLIGSGTSGGGVSGGALLTLTDTRFMFNHLRE